MCWNCWKCEKGLKKSFVFESVDIIIKVIVEVYVLDYIY